MVDRLAAYGAAIACEWFGRRAGREYELESVVEGATPVFVASSPEGRLAMAIAALWEPEADQAAEDARQMMEERLDAGSVHGPYLLWAPPYASIPPTEPEASDFVQRVQATAAPMLPGARAEVEFPIKIQVAKVRDEGGYASVIGGLSRWWTLITDRVSGTVQVNSAAMRRAPESAQSREKVFDQIAQAAGLLNRGDAVELETVEAWTLQRLATDPLGERGFAIAQAPPRIDPSEGSIVRRLVRKRLKDANAALDATESGVKGVGLMAIYEYAENENVGSFVKSLDPNLFARLQFVTALVDGEARPVFVRG